MEDRYAFGRLLGIMREFSQESDRYVDHVASLHKLHRTDLNALGFLVRPRATGTVMTPGKLGDAMNLSSPAITALVDRLQRNGHVNRHRSAVDRRQIQLDMTDHARDVGRQLFAPLAGTMGAAMTSYSAEDLELVARFLTDMTAATHAARDSLSDPASATSAPSAPPAAASSPAPAPAPAPAPVPVAVPAPVPVPVAVPSHAPAPVPTPER